jgi:tRNA threonylcarbamoyladenosine dehydratase
MEGTGPALLLGGLGLASLAAAATLSIPDSALPKSGSSANYPVEIRSELFARVQAFFGDDGLKRLENSFVIIVGLGGVGSHCAHMLVRSGVGKVRLIDFDQVTLSSLNRHAVATLEDVGISKAVAMQRRLQSIVPWCQIEAVTTMFRAEVASTLISDKPDIVIDCIDDVNTKAELIAYCVHHSIPVLTSMGAGAKADPTRLRIAPLTEVINDPLAQKIKWKLKKHGVSAEQVLSVFSIEKPSCELLPLDEEQRQNPQVRGHINTTKYE